MYNIQYQNNKTERNRTKMQSFLTLLDNKSYYLYTKREDDLNKIVL